MGSITELTAKASGMVERAFNIIIDIYLNATKGSLLYMNLKKLVRLIMNVSPKLRVEILFQLIKYTNHPIE